MSDDAHEAGQVEALPGRQQDWIRTWFLEVYNQLQEMATQLGQEDLREASLLVDRAYAKVYPPRVVRLSTHRGPGERQRVLSMLDLALGLEEDSTQHNAARARVLDLEPDAADDAS